MFDLVKHMKDQFVFSLATFGPVEVSTYKRSLNHLRKELVEVEENPSDVEEWADVLLLAFDGAMRAGHSPEDIAHAISDKWQKNTLRDWPDWRTVEKDHPIEHIKQHGFKGNGR